jgi:heme/copper-type cytochrome/quinol oxidase subunit 3
VIRQSAVIGRRVLDVTDVPDKGAFGHQGLIWWGTIGFMVIEGSMFVMALIVYFYLRLRVDEWPPSRTNPELFFGTLNLLVLLVSAMPNHLAKKAAEQFAISRVQVWLVLCVLFGVALLVIRAFEFTALNCRWDDNAYGSIVWCLMVLHSMHLATDVVDTSVLALMMFTGPVNKSRFIDVAENGLYWYFVVLWWIPIYLTVYFAPRWL